jgi:RNA polymerase sigma-70 factor (ECF subfamily)
MLRVQKGDNPAFDVLVERYKVRLFNFLLRMVGDRDRAEELAQDTFVRAYLNADKYKTIARFSTWLYTIGTNLVRNHLRAARRRPNLLSLWSRSRDQAEEEPVDLVDPAGGPDRDLDREELTRMVERAIQRIPEKYRTSFVLREVEQLSYEEIAAVTGLKLGTVRSRINRARNHFRRLMAPYLEEGRH